MQKCLLNSHTICRRFVGGQGLEHVFYSFYFLYVMCALTYIPIHNVLAEAVCCCFPCLPNFHYDVGVEMYPCIKFCLPQCSTLSVTCTYICH